MHLSSSYIDLILIFLGFLVGRAVLLRDVISFVIFSLRLGLWVLRNVPRDRLVDLESKIDGVLKKILVSHVKKQPEFDPNGAVG